MNDCYILLIGKMRFIYYELKYIKKPHVLVLPDMWLFYYKYITKLSNIAKYIILSSFAEGVVCTISVTRST